MKYIISLATRIIPRKHLQRFSQFLSKIVALFYIGNKVECPVCGKHYSKFLPYGRTKSRPNALCPSCLSLERHRLIWLYLKEKTDFFRKDYKVLHIAPEYCFLKRFDKLSNIDYVTADLESPWAKVKMDVREMPFGDNSFDIIFCNHLLEHIEEEDKALSELYRVMKPGGWGIMQVPINYNREITYSDPSAITPKQKEQIYGQNDHVREYGRDYPQRLEKGGFMVKSDAFVKEMPLEQAKRYALPLEELVYIPQKPQ